MARFLEVFAREFDISLLDWRTQNAGTFQLERGHK